MKKLALCFLSILLFASCDDGDISFDSLTFPSNLNIAKCPTNELYYKAYNSELLVIELMQNGQPILDNSTENIGQQKELQMTRANTLYYRLYDSPVKADAICGNLPPANPKVIKEYVSKSGAVMLYTLNMVVDPSTTQANLFTISYNYIITFKNLVLENAQQEEIKYSTYNFGTTTGLGANTNVITFESNTINRCDDNSFYSTSNSKLLRFTIPENLPALNNSTTVVLNSSNKINLKSYKEAITTQPPTDFCTTDPAKKVAEDWTTISGNLKITHTEAVENNVTLQIYTFVLETAVFSKANRTFTVTDANLGTYRVRP